MGIRSAAALTAALLAANAAFAEEMDPAKHAEIVKLVQTVGGVKQGEQVATMMVGSMMRMLSAANPNLPPKVAVIIAEEVTEVMKENRQPLTEMAVQTIGRHFTLEEVRAINEFYATDIGKKMISVLPQLMQENMAAGMKWGQALQPQILERLRERFRKEGLDMPKSLS